MSDTENSAGLALQAILANSLVSIDKVLVDELARGKADIALSDIGMDSLARLELSIFLSDSLGDEVSEGEVQAIETFSELVSFLDAKRAR